MTPQSLENWKPLRPNLLITGTPGTGKSTISQDLSQQLGLRHIDVGAFAKERNLLGRYDEQLQCHYIDEDAVLDALEPIMTDGGVVLDHHSSDWFPERWIQIAVVLRTTTEALYDRLDARQYPKKKLDENMQAEIMQVARDEAFKCYPKTRILELDNSSPEQRMHNFVQIKKEWLLLTAGIDPEAAMVR